MEQLNFPEIKKTQFIVHSFEEIHQNATLGENVADRIASAVGSWKFIIIQSLILLIWIIINSAAIVLSWDPYPFILMNLVLSAQAAFAAPIIMMSQNRRAAKDRLEAHNDFLINEKSELEIEQILEQLTAQNKALKLIYDRLEAIDNKQ